VDLATAYISISLHDVIKPEFCQLILVHIEMHNSVDLDRSIDLADKQVSGIEADGARYQPECEAH